MNYLKQRIGRILSELDRRMVMDRQRVEDITMCECGYKNGANMPPADAVWRKFGWGETFGGSFEWHGWFRATLRIPERFRGKPVELYNYASRQSPQFITYLDGKTVQGMDPNHRVFPLDSEKSEYELLTYAYVGYNSDSSEYCPELRVIDPDTRKLYWDLRVPYDVMSLLPEDSVEFCDIRTALNEAVNLLDLRTRGTEEYRQSVRAAINYLQTAFYGRVCGRQPANVVCVGHTHIDVAWLWPFRQTREKAQRSFSTVVNMMKEYPEYKFMSSQPQLYQYVKEDDPALYEEIKELVRQGRWEVEGAMWLEADCNLPNGESLVRRILYGKAFIREEFGKESKILWLPDVFGYSAAMPQILRKSGVTKFFTSKISWNETNQMPYDVFRWKGIDGSEVFSYFLTSQGYDSADARAFYTGDTAPKWVKGTWERFQQKDIAREAMLLYGHGDGGGGPTREMVEIGRRLEKGIPGCPSVTFEFAGDFLDRMEKTVRNNRFLPEWVGELYLEYHRGTYTSIAKNKKNNRRSEFLYQTAELASTLASVLLQRDYPYDRLRRGWLNILLCQFHDVLPGSSVAEVYEDTDRIYADVFREGNGVLDDALESLAASVGSRGGILVFNPNGFANSSAVTVDGKRYWAEDVPPMGWKVIGQPEQRCGVQVSLEKRTLENRFLRVRFDKNFEIRSIYDKQAKREVVPAGSRANALQAFEDYPRKYDAWEITNYYEEKMWEVRELDSVNLYEDGVYAGFVLERHFQNSAIRQIIRLSDHNARIDFVTDVDWKNDHILLKAAFPTTVSSERAAYEIQYGSVERPTHRNTSWDQAKFEVCGHKWADLGEYGYGVSLLNDCKYGYDIRGGVMRLSLLKSATNPNPKADQEHHSFTYSVYPHAGDYREAGTIALAYDLNNPMRAMRLAPREGGLPAVFSAVTVDCPNIVTEVVKQAENREDVIVRLYDAWRTHSDPVVRFGFPIAGAELCDLMENRIKPLKITDNSVRLHVGPFEIVTLKLKV